MTYCQCLAKAGLLITLIAAFPPPSLPPSLSLEISAPPLQSFSSSLVSSLPCQYCCYSSKLKSFHPHTKMSLHPLSFLSRSLYIHYFLLNLFLANYPSSIPFSPSLCFCHSVFLSSLPTGTAFVPIHATMSTIAAQDPLPGLPAAQLLNRSSHGWLALCIPSFGWE